MSILATCYAFICYIRHQDKTLQNTKVLLLKLPQLKDKYFWFRISKHNETARIKITAEYQQLEVVGTEAASNYRKARTTRVTRILSRL